MSYCVSGSATTTQNNRVSDPSSLEAIRIFKARGPASCFSKIKKKLKKAPPPPPFPLILSNFVFSTFFKHLLLFIFVFSFLYFSPSLKTLFFSSSFLSSSSSSFFLALEFLLFLFCFSIFQKYVGRIRAATELTEEGGGGGCGASRRFAFFFSTLQFHISLF